MRRYWYSENIEDQQKELLIKDESFRHIFKVCRREVGDHFELINNNNAYLVKVMSVAKSEAFVAVESIRLIQPLKKPHIHLVLSFSQPKVVEKVLEKSVELGVKSLQLVSTKNSFLKGQEKIKSKVERSKKIITQAMQQTGRGEPFDLKEPKSLEEFLKAFELKDRARGFMLYEAEDSQNKSFNELLQQGSDSDDVFILVGSEGGFSKTEADHALRSGFGLITLGDQILRVETACVASISILKSSLGLW